MKTDAGTIGLRKKLYVCLAVCYLSLQFYALKILGVCPCLSKPDSHYVTCRTVMALEYFLFLKLLPSQPFIMHGDCK